MTGSMLVRHEPAGASAVRRELSHDLDRRGLCARSIDDVTLVASELVGNAIRHTEVSSGRSLGVSWSVQARDVTVSVTDDSPDLPMPRCVSADACSGRGLHIVEALTCAWGVEPTATGKRVWARVPVQVA